MKKILMTLLLAVVALSASAQKTISYEGADETVRLWDNKTAKHTNYETRDEAWKKKNSIWQTSSCELYIFKAAEGKNTGIAVAIFPGGSYTNLNLQISIAQWYASQGITAAIVKYRLPNRGHYEATLEDAMGAVRYLRTRSDLGIDPAKVGVTGSSAGGHLSTWVSNAMPVGEKPAFVIPLYGWINLYESKSLAAEKALVQLLGPGYNSQKAINLSTHLMVDENTSPTLLFLCYDDSLVPSTDGVEYYEALVRHGVKASMHIFPFGGHSVKKHTAEYQTLIIEWLKYLGL
ncbi:MAG: alpha/beta hydrolase, partial [Alistipes sp.]|nr:alpha/beta hydrolase [Alistipes sp.]